ncbi:hypothetical protein Tco_0749746 [Tanacetum coccineum]|uniref:Uncharacterized protein n=1 Tax=Tanacetum coccineum TaxID=301880 RepID=A0ABQ4YZJ1_9ASTR
MYQPPVNQHPAYQAPAHQASGVSKTDFESYVKANDAGDSLPSNTVANPEGPVNWKQSPQKRCFILLDLKLNSGGGSCSEVTRVRCF